MPRKKNTEESEETSIEMDSSQRVMGEILKDSSAHFNHIVPQNYKVSTGSYNLDIELGGGIIPCVLRCGGPAEAGKTSFSLNVARIFLKEPNRKGVYFLSDKEVTKELMERSGIKFVEDNKDWVDGTCFLLRTNVYETVCNSIKKLIAERGTTYCFILDSMDNFAPKAALEADFGESSQKGGTSAITAHFFRSFNILLPRLGHLTILISQMRDQFSISKYEKVIPKQMSSSGGRAMEHAATWAFEFELPTGKKTFWEAEPFKSKKTGHVCTIRLKKTANEKTGVSVEFPIKYGRKGGNSIWIERELCDQLLAWELIKKKGSWLNFSSTLIEECKEQNIEIKEQIQGLDNVTSYLEENKRLTEFLINKFKSLM